MIMMSRISRNAGLWPGAVRWWAVALCACMAWVAGSLEPQAAAAPKPAAPKVTAPKAAAPKATAPKAVAPKAESAPADPNDKSAPADEAGKKIDESNVRFFKLPSRKMDSWGMVLKAQVKVGGGVKGGLAVSLREIDDANMSTTPNDDGTEVKFCCKRRGKPEVVVAALEMKDGSLYWGWNSFSPAGLALSKVDESIQGMVISAATESGEVKFQPEPVSVDLRMVGIAGTASLGEVGQDMALRPGKTATDWTVAEEDGKLQYSYQGAVLFALSLNVDKKQLVAVPQAKSERLAEIEKEIAEFRQERAKIVEKTKETQDARKPSRTTGLRGGTTDDSADMNKKLLAAIDESVKALEVEKADLLKEAAKTRTADPTGCEAKVVLPNGAIVYRVRIRK